MELQYTVIITGYPHFYWFRFFFAKHSERQVLHYTGPLLASFIQYQLLFFGIAALSKCLIQKR